MKEKDKRISHLAEKIYSPTTDNIGRALKVITTSLLIILFISFIIRNIILLVNIFQATNQRIHHIARFFSESYKDFVTFFLLLGGLYAIFKKLKWILKILSYGILSISVLSFGHLLEDLILGYSLASKPGEFTEVSFWMILGIAQCIFYIFYGLLTYFYIRGLKEGKPEVTTALYVDYDEAPKSYQTNSNE